MLQSTTEYPFTQLLFIGCLLLSLPQHEQKGIVRLGTYEGKTPCRELATLLDENVSGECIKIKWRLILYTDSITGNPASFSLLGFSRKKMNPWTGKWQRLKGTKANPEATVYRLDLPDKKPLFLQRGDESVLFFLDEERSLLLGNRDFSYTLNKIN